MPCWYGREPRPEPNVVSVSSVAPHSGTALVSACRGGHVSYRDRVLKLRRFEVTVTYHAAFLYWNVRGILAEKWCHGPHFEAFHDAGEQIQLSRATEQPQDRWAVAGLRASVFLSERDGQKPDEVTSLSLDWLNDCIDVLKPQLVNRVTTNVFYSYPVEASRITRARAALSEQFPATTAFDLERWSEIETGITVAARRESASEREFLTGIFGVYGPEQASDYFAWQPKGDERGLGLRIHHSRARDAGFDDPKRAVADAVASSITDATRQVHGTVRKVMNSV